MTFDIKIGDIVVSDYIVGIDSIPLRIVNKDGSPAIGVFKIKIAKTLPGTIETDDRVYIYQDGINIFTGIVTKVKENIENHIYEVTVNDILELMTRRLARYTDLELEAERFNYPKNVVVDENYGGISGGTATSWRIYYSVIFIIKRLFELAFGTEVGVDISNNLKNYDCATAYMKRFMIRKHVLVGTGQRDGFFDKLWVLVHSTNYSMVQVDPVNEMWFADGTFGEYGYEIGERINFRFIKGRYDNDVPGVLPGGFEEDKTYSAEVYGIGGSSLRKFKDSYGNDVKITSTGYGWSHDLIEVPDINSVPTCFSLFQDFCRIFRIYIKFEDGVYYLDSYSSNTFEDVEDKIFSLKTDERDGDYDRLIVNVDGEEWTYPDMEATAPKTKTIKTLNNLEFISSGVQGWRENVILNSDFEQGSGGSFTSWTQSGPITEAAGYTGRAPKLNPVHASSPPCFISQNAAFVISPGDQLKYELTFRYKGNANSSDIRVQIFDNNALPVPGLLYQYNVSFSDSDWHVSRKKLEFPEGTLDIGIFFFIDDSNAADGFVIDDVEFDCLREVEYVPSLDLARNISAELRDSFCFPIREENIRTSIFNVPHNSYVRVLRKLYLDIPKKTLNIITEEST